jgi:hypothetical protein
MESMKQGERPARHEILPPVTRAAARAIDAAADTLPELLTLPDGRMIALQIAVESALTEALKPPTPGYHPVRDR